MDFDEMSQSKDSLAEAEQKFTQAKRFQLALQQNRRKGRHFYDGWRNSVDWKQWRAQQLERQNWQCVCCEQVMKFGEKTHLTNGDFILQPNHPTVDHVLPKSYFPNLALDKQNLLMLCWSCNRQKGNNMVIASRMRHQQLKQSFKGWKQLD